MKSTIILLTILILSSCNNAKKNIPSKKILLEIEENYDIDTMRVKHVSGFKYSNPTFNRYLEYKLEEDLKNDFNGKVKRITEYYKLNNGEQKFKNSTLFNKDGYVIEKEYNYAFHKYFYNDKNNLIKEVNLSTNDTTFISNLKYNTNNQLIEINKRYPSEESNKYDWFVTIEYDSINRPNLLKNNHPIEKYSYQKEISYNDNIVTIINLENKNIEELFAFSEKNNLVKHKKNNDILFDYYNTENQLYKRIVFELDNYIRTITYNYNSNGNIDKKIISNYSEPIKKIEEVNYNYDNLGNVVYEKYTYNTKEDILEKIYEFEYFE